MKTSTRWLARAAALTMTLGYAARVLALAVPQSSTLAPQDSRYEERTYEIPPPAPTAVPSWYAVNSAVGSPAAPAIADPTPVVPARPVPSWYAVTDR